VKIDNLKYGVDFLLAINIYFYTIRNYFGIIAKAIYIVFSPIIF